MNSKLKTKEAKTLCDECNEKLCKKCSNGIMCAFRMDNLYCDRIEDIDVLINKLKKRVN